MNALVGTTLLIATTGQYTSAHGVQHTTQRKPLTSAFSWSSPVSSWHVQHRSQPACGSLGHHGHALTCWQTIETRTTQATCSSESQAATRADCSSSLLLEIRAEDAFCHANCRHLLKLRWCLFSPCASRGEWLQQSGSSSSIGLAGDDSRTCVSIERLARKHWHGNVELSQCLAKLDIVCRPSLLGACQLRLGLMPHHIRVDLLDLLLLAPHLWQHGTAPTALAGQPSTVVHDDMLLSLRR